MFYAYVLKSISHNFYNGHCSDLQVRLQQRNAGMTKSIKLYVPFAPVYSESFNTLHEAINREIYFKSSAGRRFLKNKITPCTMPARPAVRAGSPGWRQSDGDSIRVSEALDPPAPTRWFGQGFDSWRDHFKNFFYVSCVCFEKHFIRLFLQRSLQRYYCRIQPGQAIKKPGRWVTHFTK